MKLLIKNVRPGGGEPVDVTVTDGRIGAIEAGAAAGAAAGAGSDTLDGRGRLLLPGLVDAHAHLDKTTWGTPYRPHSAGPTLAELTANERAVRGTLPAGVAERAGALLDRYIAAGITHVRSHVDVDTEAGLASVEGVLAAAAARAHAVDVEVVAFPQSGLLARPGTAELLGAAVASGAHLMGGIDPAGFDGDPVRHLDTIFGLAERAGCGLDIHLHDRGELGAWQLDLIAERAIGLGLPVTVSHAFALSTVDDVRQGRLVEALAAAGIAVTTVAPGRVAPLPLRRLTDAGVPVGLGQDGVRDLWSPYGTGDLMEKAMLLAYLAGWRRDEDIELALHAATHGGAAVCGLTDYGLRVGDRADLVLIDGATPAEVVVSRPTARTVLKAGVIVSGSETS